jgi:hypothetical protein
MIKTKHFHIIYLSLIALSTFFYFTKINRTDALYEHLRDSLTHSSKALIKLTEGAYSRIVIDVEIEPRYEKYLKLAEFINATTDNFVVERNKPINQSQINKDSCEGFQKRIYEYLVKNISFYDTSELKKKSVMNFMLKQNSFWDNTSKISNAGLAAKVKTIKNNAIIDKATLMNYCLDKSSGGGWSHNDEPFRIYILPHKLTYFEDDSVDIGIFIGVPVNRSHSEGVYANGDFLKSKYGVSSIKIKNLKVGKHKIDLSATERSHFDGKIDTIRDVFHYEVLPQCGKNCSSSQ